MQGDNTFAFVSQNSRTVLVGFSYKLVKMVHEMKLVLRKIGPKMFSSN